MKDRFESAKELLHFVLTECGDMSFGYMTSLAIHNNFDAERVFYAIDLLKEQFNDTVKSLMIHNLYNDIEDGWLDRTNLKYINIFDNTLTKLPKLPRSLKELRIHRNSKGVTFEIRQTHQLSIYSLVAMTDFDEFHIMESPDLDEVLTYLQENALNEEEKF